MQSTLFRQKGFNLIELIVVITVLGILMAGTAIYITNSMMAYTDVARRDQLTSLGRTTVERVVREIRTALPNSIRVQNNCIEFFPVKTGSVYQTLPTGVAGNTFTAVAFTPPAGPDPIYVVVYPLNTSALYASASPGPAPLAQLTSVVGAPTATVTLTAPHRFSQHAPQRRLYVVSEPVSFCIVGNNLNRYSGYGINAVQSAPPTSGNALLAENIQTSDGAASVTPFTYTPGTLLRNAIVELDFRFLIDGDWIRLSHEVQIRNVL